MGLTIILPIYGLIRAGKTARSISGEMEVMASDLIDAGIKVDYSCYKRICRDWVVGDVTEDASVEIMDKVDKIKRLEAKLETMQTMGKVLLWLAVLGLVFWSCICR